MCFALDCANLCKAAGECNWQNWEPSKVALSPPPHTRHTLCHCQLALFQSYDGDHNENDADNDVDDSDDVLLLHTPHTLCQLALFQGHRRIKDTQNGLVTVIHMF